MTRVGLFFLFFMAEKCVIAVGEVVFTQEPAKSLTLISGSRLRDMVWKHNGSEERVIMKITIDYSDGLHQELAKKIYNNSWKVEAPGEVDVKPPATLVFPMRWSGSFGAIITMMLKSPQGCRNSSVNLTMRGTAFTQEPSRTIVLAIGSKIPNMVWRHNASNNMDVFIEITFTPSRNRTQEIEIVTKPRGTSAWDRVFSKMYIKDLATLVFNDTAKKQYEGVYTMKLKGPYVLRQIRQSNISLIIQEIKPRNKYLIPIVVAVPLCALFLLTWIFILWCKRRNWIRRNVTYKRYNVDCCADEIRWDVFISYSSKDFHWMKELCETVEKPPFNLNVCLHQRDWELGRAVVDNMADSVYCSGKTLIIMSNNYLESSYCMQELQIAMHREIGSRNVRKSTILLIVIDDVSLKKLPKALRQKSFLDFSNSEHRGHLKTQLLKVLGKQEDVNEDYEMGIT